MEHRLDHRRPVSINGRLHINGRTLPCRIVELSTGGLRVDAVAVKRLGLFDVVEVEFPASRPEEQRHHLRGMVVHHQGEQIGVMFIRISNTALNDLTLAA